MVERLKKVRDLISDKDTAILIISDVNRFYFSGFRSSAGAVLITKNNISLLVDFRYAEAAKKCVDSAFNVICYRKLFDSLNELIENEGIKAVVIEEDWVTIAQSKKLKEELKAVIIDDFSLSDKLLNLRMIKSDDEIDKIITAQRITEKSYLELLNYVEVGVSEKKLALELEHLMKLNGAEKIAFDIIAISGKNTSLPHGVPSDKTLDRGDFITFDIGSVYDGYHSDMTRTIALGCATDEMCQIYDIVLKAHIEASYKIKSGNTTADVDNAARDYIISKGYGEYFGHTTGHGVGLEIHEKPTVYHTDKTVLKTNMIITNEPGIYLPGKFGVRIEDMYLVTDNGYKNLASIDKELIIL